MLGLSGLRIQCGGQYKMGTLEQADNAQEYWNARARTFPRYEDGADNYEARVLRMIRENGVDLRGKRILDVGCGSGMYTIRLAREAQSVVAVDISDEMLRILADDAAAMRLENITCVRSGWDTFETAERFDVVFASMTPAVSDDPTREKLFKYSDGSVVFIGFTERMSSDVMGPLYVKYAVTPKVFNNALTMRQWLEESVIPYTAVPVTGKWVVEKNAEEMLDSCLTTLRQYGVMPDPGEVSDYLDTFRNDAGMYVERTDYAIEILLWQKC